MILIADDDQNDALILVETLKAAGVKNELRWAVDGEDVIAYFNGEKEFADRAKHPLPTILLLDLKMPQVGGFEVLEWLRHAKPTNDVLIIILSGHGALGDIKKGYDLGARSFLVKPCRLDDIQDLVRAYSPYWQLDGPTKSANGNGSQGSNSYYMP